MLLFIQVSFYAVLKHARTIADCDGCQKWTNSIALEHSRRNSAGQRFLV